MTNQVNSDQEIVAGKYHLEISQSVQDWENSIPLIRGKRAYARAYFDHENNVQAEGVFSARLKLDAPDRSFDSLNSITLGRGNPIAGDRQRLNWDLSFNFDFDPDWGNVPNKITTGSLELVPVSDGATIKLDADDRSKEFTVEPSPCLKVTCLLLRYWNAETEDYVMPDPVQVDAIRDFVVSAFPVAEDRLEWNTITVQATNEFRSLDKLTKPRPNAEEATSMAMRELLLQTTVHRNMDTYANDDWSNTHDIRTIYLAVFNDPSDRLGGAATDSPTFPVHNIAGAAVVDLNGQIGAHELAHILGREHPGVPRHKKYGPYLGQRPEDGYFEKKRYQGFLNVLFKKTQGLHTNPQFKTPRIYESNLYFDLMTYRDPQWLSDYSYLGIKERLDDLYQDQNKRYYETTSKNWVVIGEYDLNRQTGRILFVLPTSYKGFDLQLKDDPDDAKPDTDGNKGRLADYQQLEKQFEITLIGFDIKVNKLFSVKVSHRLSDGDDVPENKKLDMPNFGIFQATINVTNLSTINLKIAGNIVDVFERNPRGQNAYSTQLEQLVCCLKKTTKDKPRSETRIENPRGYMGKNPDQSLLFYYDVIEDGYFLRFNWMAKPEETNPETENGEGIEDSEDCKEFPDSKIISTIQCKRPKSEASDPDEWVTVMISSRRKGKAWISPDLVDRPENEEDPEFKKKPFYSLLSKTPRHLHELSTDTIEIRVLFSAGFASEVLDENIEEEEIIKEAKIYFPTEFLLNQQDRKGDLSLMKLRNRSGKYRPMH